MLMRQDFKKGTERGSEKLKTPTNKMNIKKLREFLKENKETIASIANLSSIFQSMTALVTVVGIGFVALEYHTQQRASRQEKAFELYQQFNEGKFIETRNDLQEAFHKVRKENKDFSIKGYSNAMKDIWNDEYVKIISITKFFEQVAACVKKKLCDKDATRVLFGTEAKEFWETHHPFFCLQREEGDEKIGKELEAFVKNSRKNNGLRTFMQTFMQKHQKNKANCDYIATEIPHFKL